jgi:PRTRC genetic system protein E
MFVELLPLLRNRTVSLSVAVPANGDSIVLTIMPKVTDEKAEEFGSIKEAAVKALSGALTLKAQSAEELDSGLHQALLQYVGSQLTMEGSINEMVKTVKAAEEEAKEAAKAAIAAAKKKSGQTTSGSKPSTPTTAPTEEKKPEPSTPPSLFDAAPAEEDEAGTELDESTAGSVSAHSAPSLEVSAAS